MQPKFVSTYQGVSNYEIQRTRGVDRIYLTYSIDAASLPRQKASAIAPKFWELIAELGTVAIAEMADFPDSLTIKAFRGYVGAKLAGGKIERQNGHCLVGFDRMGLFCIEPGESNPWREPILWQGQHCEIKDAWDEAILPHLS
ncbi:hypothetical protein ACQ4M4_11230 [Leptolyngbya sp. AN02str]|uniref:hypothetical protein n=1 Tax=Leptolyngbya sp. AN02str TaxID=3423363 RepID=UPI003D31E236